MPTVAYRAVRKRRAFINAPKVRQILDSTLDNEVKPALIQQFNMRVDNWQHKPEFKARKFVRADSTAVTVFPAGPNKEIYKYVTAGTSPHAITPKKAKFLVFTWGGPGSYKAKTAPGGKFGGPGVIVGGELTRAKGVHHPGFPGRHFEKYIKKDYEREFRRTMENAWRRAIRSMSSG